ncbi:glucose-1-phosphate thymidylyltransferase RfbA [Brevibacterium aurantiacum]|uniref:glucose-1-phosphate thymidylyltransferase RfbA n=1 Tax=Brevibacterium aurantiacum TaxID=273384 RepID=UPI003F8E9173
MKGIILAGGTGSRLHPLTHGVSKQLMPVYDKPMIYYPLSTLMLAGIREIMVITTPRDEQAFREVLGDGSRFGIELSYAVQPSPDGLAQAFLIGRDFIGSEPVGLILGDNLFYGAGMGTRLSRHANPDGAVIFGQWVSDPSAYGVVEFDDMNNVVSLEEKPVKPKSHYAVPGIYFFDADVSDAAASLEPSSRGELEITDLNRVYLDAGRLKVEFMPRGTAWLDTGTFNSLSDASNYIRTIQERQGLSVGCPEEVAWRQGWLDDDALVTRGEVLLKSGYGRYLLDLVG